MDEETKMKLQNKEKALTNANKELGMIDLSIKDLEQTIPMYEEEYQVNIDNYNVVHDGDNFTILRPNWKYEQDPRYLANLSKINAINLKKIEKQKEQKMREFQDTLNRLNEQKSQLLPYIETLKSEISALKEE